LMLEGWLGEDHLRASLRSYMKAHQFGNATTQDLASAIGRDAGPVMDSFLNQTGVPVVKADLRCNSSGAMVAIEHTGNETIPVCVRGNGVNQTCGTGSTIALKSCPAWIYVNSAATGYYRTDWTEAQLKSLDLAALNAAERLLLVYDLRSLKSKMDVSSYLTK